jgi:mannose/cellobiose epimerase-like protein (N-acyl-D-glucosamine 2-epimerase family)
MHANQPILPPTGPSWQDRTYHRTWLKEQSDALFDFFQPALMHPKGGFVIFDRSGQPLASDQLVRQIHVTTRMVHCFAIGHLLGRPGCEAVIDHGMNYLWDRHRDTAHGGYVWSLDDKGPKDDSKQAYGHAFVLLAASSAKVVGHPLADALLQDISGILETRFWEDEHGAVTEEFSRDWSPLSAYRGQNSNMHLTEALMAAFEATGERSYLDKAERIADLIIGRHAAALDYRVAEHFSADWTLDRSYRGFEVFRPFGTTPGHWLEWTRLLLQLWTLGGQRHAWMPDAAEALFRQAVALGWDKVHGGFFYTLDWDDTPSLRHKLWWPLAEGIGAAAFLCAHRPSAFHESWYRHFWNMAAYTFIDRTHGGWHPELTEDLQVGEALFTSKADLYHALQACLIPLFPKTGSLTRVIPEAA